MTRSQEKRASRLFVALCFALIIVAAVAREAQTRAAPVDYVQSE